jgi:hypothetical protein
MLSWAINELSENDSFYVFPPIAFFCFFLSTHHEKHYVYLSIFDALKLGSMQLNRVVLISWLRHPYFSVSHASQTVGAPTCNFLECHLLIALHATHTNL